MHASGKGTGHHVYGCADGTPKLGSFVPQPALAVGPVFNPQASVVKG